MDNGEVVGIQWVAVRSGRQVILIEHASWLVSVHAVMGIGIDGCME